MFHTRHFVLRICETIWTSIRSNYLNTWILFGVPKTRIPNTEYYLVLRKSEYQIRILLFGQTIRIVFEYQIIHHTLQKRGWWHLFSSFFPQNFFFTLQSILRWSHFVTTSPSVAHLLIISGGCYLNPWSHCPIQLSEGGRTSKTVHWSSGWPISVDFSVRLTTVV